MRRRAVIQSFVSAFAAAPVLNGTLAQAAKQIPFPARMNQL